MDMGLFFVDPEVCCLVKHLILGTVTYKNVNLRLFTYINLDMLF